MKFPPREVKKPRVEIIPMIDTIFFLLVFFMITSLSMVKMKAMSVSLPRGVSASSPAASATDKAHLVILTVSDAGGYYLGVRPIQPETLGAELQARAAADPRAVVVLNVAKSQTAQTLIKLMDVVNRVRTPDGQPVTALLATEPVDKNGRALVVPPFPNGAKS